MTFQKFTILFLIYIVFIFIPQSTLCSDAKDFLLPKIEANSFSNIDSLKNRIKAVGWNNSLLKEYSRFIANSEVDLNKEIKELKKFPYSFERTFLLSLILKRQKKFKEMYDSLYSRLNLEALKSPKGENEINYLPFYDELVSAAMASELLPVLENKVAASKNKNSFYSDYINSLIFYSEGKYKKSLELLEKLIKKDPVNFSIIYQLSYTYRNLGNYDIALKLLADFRKKSSRVDNWEITKILIAEGSLYFLSGKNKKAFDLYNEGYNLSKKLNDLQEEARALVNLGIVADVEGNTDNSRKNFAAAVDIAERINDIDAEAFAYSETGVSFSFTNELIKARQNYEKSYSLYTEAGNRMRLSLLSYNLGKIYTQMFDYESALKYFQRGADYSGENKLAIILNLTGMADIYTNLSNFSRAIKLYREARDMSKEIKDVSLDAQINFSLGSLNFGLEKYKKALDYFNSSYRINNQSDAYLSAQIFNQMAVAYESMDSLKNAAEYFDKAMKLSKKNNDSYSEILSCINLASLYIKENDLKSAERILDMTKKALNNNYDKYLDAQSYLLEGKIFKARNNIHEAQKAFTKVIELANGLNEFDTQIEAYHLLAKLFEDNNLNEASESYYKSAVRLIEDVSRPLFENEQVQISYYSSKDKIYNSFAEFYLKQHEFVKAFELIDRSRSRNTMHNLNNLKLESLIKNDSLLKKIYDYEWIIHSNIYSEDETNKAKINFELLKEQLIKKEPFIKKYLNPLQSISLEQIQKNLVKNEKFLSIYTTDDYTYLFLISKDSFNQFKIDITAKDLKKLIGNISPYFMRQVTDSVSTTASFYNQDLFAFNSKAAYDLFKEMLRPAFEKINPGDKIIISASSELLTVPFEFLISKYNNTESAYNYKDKEFLVLNYDISYVPSAAIFIQQHQEAGSKNEKVLLVGDPLINNKIKEYAERRGLLEEQGRLPREIPLLPLKYSREEVREIENIIHVNTILTDKDATETNFKNDAGLNSIIHLSTHSFLFNKQPVIFFSNYYDSDNDGFLEAGEIVQLKLMSDLIVLSSCNSGLGVIDESEGILGMTKAFFEAGAKSVVVSLWTVNDKYTAKFMTLFYKNLSEGFDKSEALQQAKIEFIKKYSPNPYYWAAFVLSGNVSKINLQTNFNTVPLIIEILIILSLLLAIIYFGKFRKKLGKQGL